MQWGAEQALVNNPDIAGIINVNYRQSLKGRWREIKRISRDYQFTHIFMPFDDESGFKNQFFTSSTRIDNPISSVIQVSNFRPTKAMIKIVAEKMLSQKHVMYLY